MKLRILTSLALLFTLQTQMACGPTEAAGDPEVGGASANDRTSGGGDGEQLLTGAMAVHPSGAYAILQRNRITVLFDTNQGTHFDLPTQIDRVAFLKGMPVAVFTKSDGTVLAYDLKAKAELWSSKPASVAPSALHVSSDDSAVIVGAGLNVVVLDAKAGTLRGRFNLEATPLYFRTIPGKNEVLAVGDTSWTDHKPSTPVARIELTAATGSKLSIPNCAAPASILSDASRAFVSPTFCEEGKDSTAVEAWTNPDPVSVVDLDRDFHFVKNLPGFGPTALGLGENALVAYLDMRRIDRTMFADPTQIPDANASRYHLMIIDPHTLAFTLHPIGPSLPRFAVTRDGKGLLVDASVKMMRSLKDKLEVKGKLSIDTSGVSGEASIGPFLGEKSAFGYFDLAARSYSAFHGPEIRLERFVQFADQKTVIALGRSSDGMGGIPFRIDLSTKRTETIPDPEIGTGSIRDIGLLADRDQLLVRVRVEPVERENQFYSREGAYLSLNVSTEISGTFVSYEEKQPFKTRASCDP